MRLPATATATSCDLQVARGTRGRRLGTSGRVKDLMGSWVTPLSRSSWGALHQPVDKFSCTCALVFGRSAAARRQALRFKRWRRGFCRATRRRRSARGRGGEAGNAHVVRLVSDFPARSMLTGRGFCGLYQRRHKSEKVCLRLITCVSYLLVVGVPRLGLH